MSSVTCDACKTVTNAREPFLDLSVEIPSPPEPPKPALLTKPAGRFVLTGPPKGPPPPPPPPPPPAAAGKAGKGKAAAASVLTTAPVAAEVAASPKGKVKVGKKAAVRLSSSELKQKQKVRGHSVQGHL